MTVGGVASGAGGRGMVGAAVPEEVDDLAGLRSGRGGERARLEFRTGVRDSYVEVERVAVADQPLCVQVFADLERQLAGIDVEDHLLARLRHRRVYVLLPPR